MKKHISRMIIIAMLISLASFFAQNKTTYEEHYSELWDAVS